MKPNPIDNTASSLKGRSVFITGGASGIGASLVEAFISVGARVGFIDIDTRAGTALCKNLKKKYNHLPTFFPGDITVTATLAKAIDETAQKHKGLHILVNNAGNDSRHDYKTVSSETWDKLMQINLKPYFFSIQHALPHLKNQKAGSIINLSSNSFILGITEYPAYVAAKAGIVGLTRSWARALGPHKIRVNTVIPGWVMTPKQKKHHATPAALKQCLEEQALKIKIQPEDIAQTVLFLAGAGSRVITGQSLVVDGGRIFQ